MGSYCELYISDYPVYSSKSYVSPEIMTMFTESDKSIFRRHFSERSQIEWGHVKPSEDDFETAVEYKALTKHVKQRLDVIGFNIDRVKREFDEVKSSEVEKYKDWSKDDKYNLWLETIRILETSTFKDYMSCFSEIINSNVNPIHYLEKYPDASELLKFILKDNDGFHWGFPCYDFRSFLRALMEVCPDEAEVVQDITDLVNAGYYKKTDNVCHLALEELIGDYATSSKIIVLTEGSTDTEFLKQSLKILHPHLYDYYTFMDFGFKSPGGVGPLVNAVKSFSGAGIENRVIALFDNDTAAYSAIYSLKDIEIPKNIVITHYPDTVLATTYPALGPNGQTIQNINRLACSIELYLGVDTLTKEGQLIPIQWKGYDERIKQYQGEIMHKAEIQNLFRKKLTHYSKNNEEINSANWKELQEIFLHIFGVFNA